MITHDKQFARKNFHKVLQKIPISRPVKSVNCIYLIFLHYNPAVLNKPFCNHNFGLLYSGAKRRLFRGWIRPTTLPEQMAST
jgi:hypothetical protein